MCWRNTVNETQEEAKFKFALEPTQGNAAFGQLPVPAPFNQPNRGVIELRDSFYGVNGNVIFYLSPAGIYTQLAGGLPNDHNPVSMVANGNGQIFVASAGQGSVIQANGPASTVTGIPIGDFLGASHSTFQDGYILNVVPNSNRYQISGDDNTPLGDATVWSAANVSVQAGQADYLRAIISSREYVRILGQRRSQIQYNVGSNGIGAFPFQSYNETFIETGIGAVFSLADLGDSLIWMGQDARGQRACWRDAAFQPQRVSTFAVEQFWQSYSKTSDAVAFSYIWQGHLIYRITFPTASVNSITGAKTSATWEYDVTASQLAGRNLWTELQYNSSTKGLQGRAELFHAYCYDRHLVGSGGGDGNPGAIYQMSAMAYSDCGTEADGSQSQRELVRDRIAPHLWINNSRVVYDRLQLECARGVGLDGAPATGVNPQMILRCSRDYGNTFGRELNAPVGAEGQYAAWVYWLRLGQARDLVTWVRYTEPTYMAIVNAELDLRECS